MGVEGEVGIWFRMHDTIGSFPQCVPFLSRLRQSHSSDTFTEGGWRAINGSEEDAFVFIILLCNVGLIHISTPHGSAFLLVPLTSPPQFKYHWWRRRNNALLFFSLQDEVLNNIATLFKYFWLHFMWM